MASPRPGSPASPPSLGTTPKSQTRSLGGPKMKFAWGPSGHVVVRKCMFSMEALDELDVTHGIRYSIEHEISWKPDPARRDGRLRVRMSAPVTIDHLSKERTEADDAEGDSIEFLVRADGRFLRVFDLDELGEQALELSVQENGEDVDELLPEERERMKLELMESIQRDIFLTWYTWVQIWLDIPDSDEDLAKAGMLLDGPETLCGRKVRTISLKWAEDRAEVIENHKLMMAQLVDDESSIPRFTYKRVENESLLEGVIEPETMRPHTLLLVDSRRLEFGQQYVSKTLTKYVFYWEDVPSMLLDMEDMYVQEISQFRKMCDFCFLQLNDEFELHRPDSIGNV